MSSETITTDGPATITITWGGPSTQKLWLRHIPPVNKGDFFDASDTKWYPVTHSPEGGEPVELPDHYAVAEYAASLFPLDATDFVLKGDHWERLVNEAVTLRDIELRVSTALDADLPRGDTWKVFMDGKQLYLNDMSIYPGVVKCPNSDVILHGPWDWFQVLSVGYEIKVTGMEVRKPPKPPEGGWTEDNPEPSWPSLWWETIGKYWETTPDDIGYGVVTWSGANKWSC